MSREGYVSDLTAEEQARMREPGCRCTTEQLEKVGCDCHREEVTFMDGRTFRRGERVRFHSSVGCSGFGTIFRIRQTPQGHEMLHIMPEEGAVFGPVGHYQLNPEAAKRHWKPDWMRVRDMGVSGGQLEKVA